MEAQYRSLTRVKYVYMEPRSASAIILQIQANQAMGTIINPAHIWAGLGPAVGIKHIWWPCHWLVNLQ